MSVRQKKIIRITAICIVAVLFLLAGTEIWITRKVETVIEQTIRKQGGIPRKIHIGIVSFNPWSRTARLNEIKFQIEFFREKTDIDLKIDHIVIEKLRLHGKNGIEFTTIDLETPILSMTRHGTENPTDSIRNNTTKPIERTPNIGNALAGSVRVTNGSLHIFEEKNGKQIHHAFQNLSFMTGRLDKETFVQDSTAAVHGLHLSIRQVQYQFDENALRLEADTIVLAGDSIHIGALRLLPLYTQEEFAALAPGHADWIQITSRDINGYGIDPYEWLIHKNFTADSLDIGAARIESYKNRNIAQDQRVKPLFFQLLSKISDPVNIRTIGFRDVQAIYSELAPDKNTPGVIAFDKISGSFRGVTNRPKDSEQNINFEANGLFQHAVPMRLSISWPADTTEPHFVATGELDSMALSLMNSITEPIADLKIDSGRLQRLTFRIEGDSTEAETELSMLYNNLRIELIHRKDGKIRERKLFSTVLDDFVLIPNNPHLGQTRIGTGTTLRNPYRSQFNYLWKSIETGIKSTLINRHIKHDKPYRSRHKHF